MNPFKLIFVVVIPIILLTSSLGAYLFASEKNLFKQSPATYMNYELYNITKTQQWKNRFNFLTSKQYNSAKRTIVGARQNYLQVRRGYQTYLIEYDAQIDIELITQVRQVRQSNDNFNYNGRYFLVQYDKFVEIVYFDTRSSTTPLSSQVQNGTYQAEICLELPIQASNNVRYHIDQEKNIWIVSASMNKVVFIQIYSCIQRKLIKEFRYILSNQQYVNQVSKIIKKNKECMGVEVVTYSLNIVELQVCPYKDAKSIKEIELRKSHQVAYSKVQVKDYEVFEAYTQSTYYEQLQRIAQYIVNIVTFSRNSSLLYDRKPSLDQNKKQQFDAIAIDQDNHYLINFSKNTTYSGIMSLNKYLINTKNPLFHNNPNYNKYNILEILDREYKKQYNPDIEHKYIVPGINQTKKVVYKAAYQLYPNFKAEYLGLTSNLLIFWPQHKLDDKDYTFIRTSTGGLVSQGTKLKGTFDKFPVSNQQVFQRVDAKAQQVIPKVYQVHIGYFNLMTYLVISKDSKQYIRVQLLNMLGGTAVITHYINNKQGFSYTSTMLLNNEWWVLQYSKKSKTSIATKYELYTNATNSVQILNLKRVYGVINSEQHLNGEDDLAQLMNQFVKKYNNGFMLLNIYRCIDEYYYIEYSDSNGDGFGVARIHFKNLSNRRIKKSNKYSGLFEKQMLLEEKQMIPEKYSRRAYSVYFHNLSVLKHLGKLQASRTNQTWHHFCQEKKGGANFNRLQKMGSFYYFPISHYRLGQYGCNYNSDESHNEQIYVFNLRNMIINGKIQKEDKKEIRKNIVSKMFLVTLIYIVLIAFIRVLSSKSSQSKTEADNNKMKKDN